MQDVDGGGVGGDDWMHFGEPEVRELAGGGERVLQWEHCGGHRRGGKEGGPKVEEVVFIQ